MGLTPLAVSVTGFKNAVWQLSASFVAVAILS
jgi:hypothetical protein